MLPSASISKIRIFKGILVDVTGIEPATPCLQSKRKFNLSRCFGCA